MSKYRRDNREFREHIARKARPKLSTWQGFVIGLVVNVVKAYCFVIAGFGEWRAKS